ncbi:MAG: sigma 54-interacting transcriptional regulator [bacterium]|nr:sigma 54-interacting transcriptional regulator [bacterium]
MPPARSSPSTAAPSRVAAQGAVRARGAFTGAVQERVGLFEAANGGTLLLDEIGDVSPGMQVKLLRVLQEREIRRVGENRSRPVNVRVIAATNRELTDDIAEGRFRMDLYYRLNVVQVHVPALRDRREDILPLARVLLMNIAKRMKRPVTGFTPRRRPDAEICLAKSGAHRAAGIGTMTTTGSRGRCL